MPKFLGGESYDGERVPVCTYWSTTQTTDPEDDYATIVTEENQGRCIANAFFNRNLITCFNNGDCNGEGKCIPCSKYSYNGMRLAITHSPPLEILRQFNGGLTEEEIKSPNFAQFPAEVVTAQQQDQLPYHILIRNIQARIAKCCRWNQGNGEAHQFYLATILDGPDTVTFTDANGQESTFTGIRVTHEEFPDDTGTFYPAGTVVVAGFASEPSFYLEPRTGLVKPGEGVIFPDSQESPVAVRIKQKATSATALTIDITNATLAVCASLTDELNRTLVFLNNAQTTGNGLAVLTLEERFDALQPRQETACVAATEAQDVANEINTLIGDIVAEEELDALQDLSETLGEQLNLLADKAEAAASVGLGDSAARLAGNLAGIARQIARDISQAAFRSFSKCQFFFTEENIAEQWNNPKDGTLPCNGIRTDCDFYTGKPWEHATDEKMDTGQSIKAEALQELRWRSDDWSRFSNPEDEFEGRFSTPFIWAFKGYVDVSGQPDLQDMLLYRPKVLFSRDVSPLNTFETMQVEKVVINNFDEFSLSKSLHRVEPGSHSLDVGKVPEFPSIISSLSVPIVTRLRITHPNPEEEEPFIYRTWSPDKNKFTLFGTGTPEATVYLVNETALQQRSRYHTYLGTSNFETDLPTVLPNSPNFVGITASALESVFRKLEDESRQTESDAPLGFSTTTVETTGFWRAIKSVDLVHGFINKIFAFILVDDFLFTFDSVEVDYRFLHSIPIQTNFTGENFTIQDPSGLEITILSSDVTTKAEITAQVRQTVGNETVGFGYGYYGLRFLDRGLRANGGLNADNDLEVRNLIVDEEAPPTVADATSSNQITSVGYNVVQYKKTDVVIEDWYVVDDCGSIMIKIGDTTAHRVLPLPDATGENPPLQDVLVNGGGTGSEVAQFAIESATISTELGDKKLIQIYRDTDGDGIPANYILLGPSPEIEEAFGRPNRDTDSIKITYTYLEAQTCNPDGTASKALNDDEVIIDNFNLDLLRQRSHLVDFSEDGTLSVGKGNLEDGTNGSIRDLNQEYVWVFTDSDGRPIGRKYSRMMVLCLGFLAINVEIYYGWEGSCTTYGLLPDQYLIVGTEGGSVSIQPQGVTEPGKLQLGFRLAENLIGSGQVCNYTPSCGDHEFFGTGGIRAEFEVITEIDGERRAFFPGAGQRLQGNLISALAPGTQYNKLRGPVWYPYTACLQSRYESGSTFGPQGTRSTELINEQLTAAGFAIGVNILQDNQVKGSAGTFGNLPPASDEAYRGPDLVEALVLDIHPSLRACTTAYTYGNKVLDGRISTFAGAARKRGALSRSEYGEKGWTFPPFGNFGRNLVWAEVSDRRGDYLTDAGNSSFRWMPVFPDREGLGAGVPLFGEGMEPQLVRMLQSASPLGSINESVDTDNPERYTHKSLVWNPPRGGVDYPYVGFYPSFLSDTLVGLEPDQREGTSASEDISTMWAWREQEKAIGRGLSGNVLTGLKFQSPDYILDNRALEVRLRPSEGPHIISFRPPIYNQETGEILNERNGSLQLDTGPERQIKIDFVAKTLSVAEQEDTVYDLTLDIGDSPFPCTPGAVTDNQNFTGTCTCEKDVTSSEVDNENFPSRFLHLDEQAPEGYFTLYESTELETPFAAQLNRSSDEQPCCQCVYYIRGLYVSMDVEYLPATSRLNPARDSRISLEYTWSRVPHGDENGQGDDQVFASNEGLADFYISSLAGLVFKETLDESIRELDTDTHLSAFFPSQQYAGVAIADGNPIQVNVLPTEDLKEGAIPAFDGFSRGETERIALAFRFDTYVQVNSISIDFFSGSGWEVPIVILGAVDPENRGPSAPKPTLRNYREVARSNTAYVGTQNPSGLNGGEIAIFLQGLPEGAGIKRRITLTPSYIDTPFWNRYAMEYLLVFEPRSAANSMGIAAVEVNVNGFVPNSVARESIQIWERKYYRSTGTPAGATNPEGRLQGVGGSSAYWRTADQNAIAGANKYRAYAWGEVIEDNQEFIRSQEPKELEALQEEEVRKALDGLNGGDLSYSYTGFLPIDEQEAITFYGGRIPSWTNVLSNSLSPIDEIRAGGVETGGLIFGEIPERESWSAPGHAWTYTNEGYQRCAPGSVQAMVINYNYAHLHDDLAVVETASFWDELPSGLTNILRSTQVSPDPFFGQGDAAAGTGPGGTGQAQLLDASSLEGVPLDVLEAAGFQRDSETGALVRVVQGGE